MLKRFSSKLGGEVSIKEEEVPLLMAKKNPARSGESLERDATPSIDKNDFCVGRFRPK